MQRCYILEQWNDYVRQVVPKGASREQLIETKRAFYAGAFSVFCSVLKAVTEQDDELKLCRVYEEIEAEGQAFVQESLRNSVDCLRDAIDALP